MAKDAPSRAALLSQSYEFPLPRRPKSPASPTDILIVINDKTNAYLQSRVMSASPQELRLLLIEGAIKYTRIAREGIVARDYESVYLGVQHAQAILVELLNALKPDEAPELCARLSGLYTFLYRRLMDACTERDLTVADEILGLLEYERETWLMLMRKFADEQPNLRPAAVDSTGVGANAGSAAPTDDAPVSLTGSGSRLSIHG